MGARIFTVYMWSFYVLLFLFFFILISVTFVLTFWFDPYRKITNRELGWMAWFMVHPWPAWKIHIEGAELIQKDKPTIFVSNHESFVDIPLIYQLPIRMKWVVKHSMTYIPVMGWMVKLTGQLTINRSKRSAIKKLERLVKPLRSGVPVMLIVEGAFEALRPGRSVFNPKADLKVKVLPVIPINGFGSMSELKDYVFNEMAREKELLEKSTVK